jgi:hypothetical protein
LEICMGFDDFILVLVKRCGRIGKLRRRYHRANHQARKISGRRCFYLHRPGQAWRVQDSNHMRPCSYSVSRAERTLLFPSGVGKISRSTRDRRGPSGPCRGAIPPFGCLSLVGLNLRSRFAAPGAASTGADAAKSPTLCRIGRRAVTSAASTGTCTPAPT